MREPSTSVRVPLLHGQLQRARDLDVVATDPFHEVQVYLDEIHEIQ